MKDIYQRIRQREVKYEVTYANGSKTNIELGNPNHYDFLFIILGSNSVINGTSTEDGEYLIYKIDSSFAKKHFNSDTKTYSFAKKVLRTLKPINRIT